jgi:hypothetical protein
LLLVNKINTHNLIDNSSQYVAYLKGFKHGTKNNALFITPLSLHHLNMVCKVTSCFSVTSEFASAIASSMVFFDDNDTVFSDLPVAGLDPS